jgi:hypothetical protein
MIDGRTCVVALPAAHRFLGSGRQEEYHQEDFRVEHPQRRGSHAVHP